MREESHRRLTVVGGLEIQENRQDLSFSDSQVKLSNL